MLIRALLKLGKIKDVDTTAFFTTGLTYAVEKNFDRKTFVRDSILWPNGSQTTNSV